MVQYEMTTKRKFQKKHSKSVAFLIFVLIFNFWIWRVFAFNIFLGVLLIFSSLFLLLALQSEQKKYFYLVIATTSFLLFFQWKTSHITPISYLNEHETLLLQERLRGYPPIGFSLGSKKIWIPVANWLELRRETLAFYKMQANISEVLDPNLYFFANHPRERVGVVEVENFPYVFFPAFVFGFFALSKKDSKLVAVFLSPLVLISLIGNSSPAGPLSLFPVVAVLTSLGLEKMITKKTHVALFIVLFVFIFIQTYAYTIY